MMQLLGMMSPELARELARKETSQMKPKTDPVARVLHLKEIFERQQSNSFAPGDIVTPTPDAGVNPAYVGEPHVVMKVWVDKDDGTVYHRVTTLDVDGGAQSADLLGWQLQNYEVPS